MKKFLNDISQKEKFSVQIIYFSVGATLVFAALIFFIFMNKAKEITNKAKDEVYVMVDNQVLKTVRSNDYGQATEASIKGVVNLFNDYFWNLEPYQEYINDRHQKAFNMSDESVKRLRKSLNNQNFYIDIINSKSSTQIQINPADIIIDYTVKPYKFSYKGKFIIRRGQIQIIHNIEASGMMEQKKATDNNFTGWLIRDYKLDKLEQVEEINSGTGQTEESQNNTENGTTK